MAHWCRRRRMRGRCRPVRARLPVTIENPPGLYGTEEGVFAHNLLDAGHAPSRRWRGRKSQRR